MTDQDFDELCKASAEATEAHIEAEALAKAKRNKRARLARRVKDETMRGLGMVKVRGSLGGTYYE